MSDIQPGDLVQAIPPEFACPYCAVEGTEDDSETLAGNIYRVARVARDPACDGLMLHGAGPFNYSSCCFRKIDKSDEGFAAWMRSLKPVPAKQKDRQDA